MAKATSKKPKFRLKKQVKRTIGGILLASAVAVAAIPAGSRAGGNVEASVGDTTLHTLANYETDYSVKVVDYDNSDNGNIPRISNTDKIYTDESKAFEFAYVKDLSNNYVAVIVGYGTLSLDNGTLTIPETVDAFTQYNTNSTNGQLVAVGKNGNFLFYPKAEIIQEAYDEVVEDPAGANLTDDSGRQLFTDSAANYVDSPNTVTRYYRVDDPEVKYYNVDTDAEYVGVNPLRALHVSKIESHEAVYDTNYVPCYLDTINEWKDYTDYELYRDIEHPTGDGPAYSIRNDSDHGVIYEQCQNSTEYHRIKDAAVAYISDQYAERGADGVWRYNGGNSIGSANAAKGIFANNANISTLKIKGTLVGIGENAFYGCSGLSSLDLSGSNGLQVIGPGAFSDCYQLSNVTFTAAGQGTNLRRIGERAFYNCRSIRSIVLPKSVTTLGDSCFEGCVKMTTLDLCGDGDGSDCALAHIGIDVFKDCQSITELVFPWNAKGEKDHTLLLSEFSGCTSLGKVSVRNEDLSFVEEPYTSLDANGEEVGGFTFKKFKKQQGTDNQVVAGTFYFEGFTSSKIHDLCNANCFAFHYINANNYSPLSPDIYELKVQEDGGGYVTYQVNVNNELQFPVNFEGNVESLSFPDHIGPYHIASIAANAFNNKCTLKRITIPSTITSIGEGAFRGCHNVEYVVFNNNSVQIGLDAFKTQDFAGAHTGGAACTGLLDNKVGTNADNTPAVKLTFVGPIDENSTPYRYAMSQNGTYNNGSQATSYIEYCSGWPTFITVRYGGEDTAGDGIIDTYYSELVDFPTIACLTNYSTLSYLTDDQKDAAAYAIANMNNPAVNMTEDQTKFADASRSLTIPTGINRIKDGLYYNKTQGADATNPLIGNTGAITEFPIIIMDLDSIDASLVLTVSGDPEEFPKDEQGVIYHVDPEKSDFAGCTKLNSVTIYGGADKIDDYAFYGCTNLNSVIINSPDTTEIGDYAFGGCDALSNASIASNVSSLGLAPFAGDGNLDHVEFNNSSNFKCDSQVIYSLIGGTPKEIVEVLPSRNSSLRSDAALTSVTGVRQDAFNTSSVGTVDLSKSPISELPYHAFYNATSLSRAILPNACTTVGKYVFEDSTVSEVSGSESIVYPPAEFLDNIDLGGGLKTSSTVTTNNKKVTVYAPENSNLNTYAVRYEYNAEIDLTPKDYTVNFYGYDSASGLVTLLVSNQTVTEGRSPSSAMAIYSVVSEYTDNAGRKYIMDGWETRDRSVYSNAEIDAYIVDGNVDFYARYILADTTYHTVTFNDYYGQAYKTFQVIDGDTLADEQLDVPVLPDIVDEEGTPRYNSGWQPDGTVTVDSPITRDVTFNPVYSKTNGPYVITLQYSDPTDGIIKVITTIDGVVKGSDATAKINLVSIPTFDGYVFAGWDKAIRVPDSSSIKNVDSDIVLTGSYIDNVDGPYTVTLKYFDPTDNTSKDLQVLENVAKGSDISGTVSLITPPSFAGYVFNGWGNAQKTPDNADLTNVTGNYVLIGQYINDTNGPFTVTLKYFDPTDNTSKELQVLENVAKGSDISGTVNLITPPSFAGYNFNGWNNAQRSPEDADLTNVTGNYVLIGQYVQNTSGPFTITLQYKDPGDGTIKVLTAIDNVEAGSDVTSKINVITPPSIDDYVFDGWANAILSPNDASLSNVMTDITITGTYTSTKGGGNNYNGEDPDIAEGRAFYAFYYYPNGRDLYTKIKVNKGDVAYDLIKPEGYTKGYEWSPNPLETVMEANHNFILVPSEGTDINETYTVSYYYSDGITLYQQLEIETGTYAPKLMMPAGYTKCVWSPSPETTAIVKNTRFTMVAGSGNSGEGGGEEGGNGGSNTDSGNYYTLTVVNGSGSGTYKEGTQAIIVANEPANGLQFGSWTISPDNAPIASKGLSATIITMPSENVTVTANYVTKTSNNSSSGGNNNNNNGGSNGNSGGNGNTNPSGGRVSSGTTVVIDKNGLSNTGVVSAVVNGSSDNFTIKISESSAASEAVLKALQAAYGDITKIMYFPMDISLYDASGEKKITDTSGLTVTITLPIPDSMVQYAGNNKVAAVINNQLDVLSPKFTTINGVSCVTFTCTHFSPYVIYVNTETISTLGDNSGASDQTPKTGDGIKPKWFLATGLAALGVFFFIWTGGRKKKTAAKN